MTESIERELALLLCRITNWGSFYLSVSGEAVGKPQAEELARS